MSTRVKIKSVIWNISLFLVFSAFISLPAAAYSEIKTNESPRLAPISSVTPSGSSLPGEIVVPIEKMDETYPWLPLDKSARPATYFFYFNLRKAPFSNVLVRQAFAAAIDRDVLVKAVEELGVKDPYSATTFTPAETLGRDLNNSVGIPFNPEHARILLAQAGYSEAGKFPPVSLLIGVNSTDIPGYHEKVSELVSSMWEKNLGITVKVEKLDFNAFVDRIFTDPPEIFRSVFFPGNNDPHEFMSNFTTKTKFNLGGYEKPEYDRLIDLARKAKPPLVRQVEYIQAEKMLTEEDTAILPVFHLTYIK